MGHPCPSLQHTAADSMDSHRSMCILLSCLVLDALQKQIGYFPVLGTTSLRQTRIYIYISDPVHVGTTDISYLLAATVA